MRLALLVALSVLAGLGALGAAALLFTAGERTRARAMPWLLSYAIGTLLGASTLGLLTHALEQRPGREIMAVLLGGLFLFFVLQKLVLWRHCHDASCDAHAAAAPTVLLGDSIHNFVDGVILAAAVHTSVPLGLSTAAAVIAHEIPQELGDFAILINAGYPLRRALFYNALSSLASVAGAVVGYFVLERVLDFVPHAMTVAAASFLYVAIGDLIPMLHQQRSRRAGLGQALLIVAGMVTSALLHRHG